jgi:hypothetical protein
VAVSVHLHLSLLRCQPSGCSRSGSATATAGHLILQTGRIAVDTVRARRRHFVRRTGDPGLCRKGDFDCQEICRRREENHHDKDYRCGRC